MINKLLELCELAHAGEDNFGAKYWKLRSRFDIKRMSKKKRREVFKWLSKSFCYCCDSQNNLHRHHKIPLSRGGDNSSENIILLCRSCHESVHGYEIRRVKKKKPVKLKIRRSPMKSNKKKSIVSSGNICAHGSSRKWCVKCRYNYGK